MCDGGAGFQEKHAPLKRHFGPAAHDNPVLIPVVMHLKRKNASGEDFKPLDLEALSGVENRIGTPRTAHGDSSVRTGVDHAPSGGKPAAHPEKESGFFRGQLSGPFPQTVHQEHIRPAVVHDALTAFAVTGTVCLGACAVFFIAAGHGVSLCC
jgi:hypothetical protein